MVSMAEYRLKIKIGEHEFEAEGPADVVQSQFAAFKDLVGSIGVEKPRLADAVAESADPAKDTNNNTSAPLPMEKIMRAEGRLISLTVRAASIQDAILALLLGQRQYRANDSVTGSEILDGLRESGQAVSRIDHTLNQLSDEGSVITIGAHRGRRYRLTNAGVSRAQNVVRSMISLVP
jgi:hypothetical protein